MGTVRPVLISIMTSSPPHAARLRARPARRGFRSLERRLPLLITALLAVTLAVSLGLVYLVVRDSMEEMAAEKLRDATQTLGAAGSASVTIARQRLGAQARGASVRQLLARARGGQPVDSAAVRAALAPFLAQGDSTLLVELWTVDGRRVASIGEVADTGWEDGQRTGADVFGHRGVDGEGARDSLAIGALYAAHGSVYYWLTVPVRGRGGPTEGYVALQRRIRGAPEIEERLRGLVGEAVSGYYRTTDGSLWATLAGEPVDPPSTAGQLVAADSIEGMSVLVVLHQPRSAILAPVRETFARLAALGSVVLAFGALGAWLLGRSITRPLGSLTHAAEAVAQGDYASRVDESGAEEIERLGAAFNHMAATVEASRRELEERVVSARALADELATTNIRLHDANRRLYSAIQETRIAHEEAEEARQVAEAASRAKSEFLAVMSHELRTPLNAIGGYAELLEMGIRGPVTEAQRRDLGRIRSSQEHLLGLISAMLDLTRVESGRVRYDIAPVELGSFLMGLDALVEPQAAAKSLRLEVAPCAPGLAVLADREKLRQILLNLLSNAIRYTPEGGRIEVAARARDGDSVALTVRDTGVGVPPGSQERIFEPFVQLDRSLVETRDGVGLGLAISRDLARAMHGDLMVESEVDVGSTFTLVLPAAPAVSVGEMGGEAGERSVRT
ncbi:MAG TPA: ATP-binding protein [Gemmatimonadales bacterium]